MIDRTTLWIVIIGLGVGSYLIRFAFLGLIDSTKLPPWVLRHLRYTAVAMIPALVAPLVAWPAATGGTLDPARLIAALVTLAVGMWQRSLIWAILAGGSTLYALLWLLG